MNWFFTSRRGITAFVLLICIANVLLFHFLHFGKEWQQSRRFQKNAPPSLVWQSKIWRFGFSSTGIITSALITLAIWLFYMSRFRQRLNEQSNIYVVGLGLAGIGSIVVRLLIWPT